MEQNRDLFISYHTDSSKWMVEKIASILEDIACIEKLGYADIAKHWAQQFSQ